MKSRQEKPISKRMRNLLTQQVEEYAHRYHPEMGEVEVEISPCGRFARARVKNPPQGSL